MIKIKKKAVRSGIDIGSFSVKLIQLSGDLNDLSLINFELIKVEERTQDAIKRALVKIAEKLSAKEVNIAISGPALVVRYIELPKMTGEELKSSMKFEAAKYIPFDIKDVMIDCQILENIGHNRMRVLLAAAKREAISHRINLAESAGLSVRVVDCDSFALTNAFLLNFPDIGEGINTALLNLGERLTTIEILKGKAPYFTRELQIGGWDFTKAISERLNLDMDAASRLKERPEKRFQELMEAVKPIVTHIVEEIRLSLSYYENQIGMTVDKICLSGGLSNFMGLIDIFSESLGVTCELWDPFKCVKVDKELPLEGLNKVKSQLAVALGLAIRG